MSEHILMGLILIFGTALLASVFVAWREIKCPPNTRKAAKKSFSFDVFGVIRGQKSARKKPSFSRLFAVSGQLRKVI